MKIAHEVARKLADSRVRIVFAESCTCGMIACELGKVPGVSAWLCGSAVTYRDDTKVLWLGVNQSDIDRSTAVSDPVARQMAEGVLSNTPEADLAFSTTGHFGPAAPAGLDGVVFVGVAKRVGNGSIGSISIQLQLSASERTTRQIEATQRVFAIVLENLSMTGG